MQNKYVYSRRNKEERRVAIHKGNNCKRWTLSTP